MSEPNHGDESVVKPPEATAETVFSALIDIATRHPEEKEAVTRIMALISRLTATRSSTRAAMVGRGARAQSAATYRVEDRHGESLLVEERSDLQQQLTSSETLVRLTIETLTEMSDPTTFNALHAAVAHKAKRHIPEYPVRTTMRWLRSIHLVRKIGRSYQPVKAMKSKALAVWEQLRRVR